MWRRSLVSTLILACAVGVLTTGCVVAAGDDGGGWRRDRWHDRHDTRWDPNWDYRQREHRW
jgi:hypothetical protein